MLTGSAPLPSNHIVDDGQYWLYFSALDKLNERINMDVWPREFFYADVQDGDFFHLYPNAHTEIMEVNTWISPAGTTTPAHYDLPHNFYIQVGASARQRLLVFFLGVGVVSYIGL